MKGPGLERWRGAPLSKALRIIGRKTKKIPADQLSEKHSDCHLAGHQQQSFGSFFFLHQKLSCGSGLKEKY